MKKLLQILDVNKLLVLILLIAAVSRLWNIEGYMDFKGDEGRDMRVVARFIKDFDLMFIGPRTSIGDMYLGPLYYYLISPALLLANFNPVGPSIMVALIGIATVWLIWYVAKEWFGKLAAYISSGLYAISPVVIENSRDSWNPNVMPFFALLTMYTFWRSVTSKNYKWLLITGVAFASAMQSHYLGLLLLPTLGLAWVYGFWKLTTNRFKLIKYSLISLGIFVLLMSPIFIFDLKHNWQNTNSFIKFFTQRQETVSARPWSALPRMWDLWNDSLIGEVVIKTENDILRKLVGVPFLITCAWFLMQQVREMSRGAKTKQFIPFLFVLLWLGFGMLGLGSLKQNVYAHYLGVVSPAPFLLIGAFVSSLWLNKNWLGYFKGKNVWVIVIPIIVAVNLINNPLGRPANNELSRVQQIDKKIIEESGGRKFNFGLVADRNYDEGYLYFFELWNAPVTQADPQHPQETITDQLFVVCEQACTPTTSSKAEIAHFGMTKIEKEWEVGGYKLYKLVHSEGNTK